MKKYFVIFLLLSFNILSFSKDKIKLNPRKRYPVGVTLNLLGPSGHLAMSINAFVIPKINIEAGYGIFNINSLFVQSMYLGGKYHFGGNTISNTTFYLGIYDDVSYDLKSHHLYFPLGVHKIKRNHLTWSLEIAFQPDKAYYDSTLWGAFKIGYQFGFKKHNKNIKLKSDNFRFNKS